MKKAWLFLFVGVFMLGIVSGGVCDDNQTIMKLYQQNNSHGTLWNDTNYTWDICYNEIFGVDYTGANPHECTGTNRILSLSDVTNAHASNVSNADYPIDVCYGNLACVYEQGADDVCANGGKVIARMYSGTNSHISDATNTNYLTKICCEGSEIYWANANGVEITQADEVNIGDTIQAVATGIGSGTFNVWEDDFIGDDNITSIVDGESIGGNWVGKWTITQSDLDKTAGFDSFYFKINGGNKSEYINISEFYDDSLMDVTIVTPVCGSDYNKDDEVMIEISAMDEDDFLEGNLTIGGSFVANFTNGVASFPYTFDVAGNIQIVAEAVNTRGKRARHISNVMVLGGDGSYVAACIDKPKDFSDMEESEVAFDASTTRAIVVDGGVPTSYNPVDNPTKFSWYWRFMPEDLAYPTLKERGTSLAYKFTARFPIAGDNSAGLRVEFS